VVRELDAEHQGLNIIKARIGAHHGMLVATSRAMIGPSAQCSRRRSIGWMARGRTDVAPSDLQATGRLFWPSAWVYRHTRLRLRREGRFPVIEVSLEAVDFDFE
jgi:hypothetical protein